MKKVNKYLLREKKVFLTGMILAGLCLTGCSNASVRFLESELQKEEEIVQLTPTAVQEEANSNDMTQQPETRQGLETEQASVTGQEGSYVGEQQEDSFVYVYVCGAVVNPGVYEMEADSRVFQAVEMAGGVLENAAAEYVNQAMAVTDGQQIYIPWQDEVAEQKMPGFTDGETTASDKVNINTADEAELMTISGIGESRAKDIIAYREEYGGFSAIEEIMNVPGIKEATFEKIKDGIDIK